MLNRAFLAQLAPFLDELWRGAVHCACVLVARPLFTAMAKLCGLPGAPRSEGMVRFVLENAAAWPKGLAKGLKQLLRRGQCNFPLEVFDRETLGGSRAWRNES